MKEINILCVEDGSVDVESLENEGLHDGKVVIYRQGANPPFVLKLKTDDGELKSEQNKVAVEKLEQVKEELLREWVPVEVAKVLGPYVTKIKEMIKELKGEK